MPHLGAFSTAGWLRGGNAPPRWPTRPARSSCKSTGLRQLVGNLSGGNQQKIVLARWLTRRCSVLLLDEPTRGVDVGARGEIYTIVRNLAAKGLTVVLVSSDMPELIGLSHRVHVMRSGGVAGELSRDELDQPTRRDGSSASPAVKKSTPRERHPHPSHPTYRERGPNVHRHRPRDRPTAPPDAAPAAKRRFDQTWLDQLPHPQLHGDRASAGDGLLQLPQRALRHPGERTHHSGGCRPVRPGRAGPDVRHPHRWHRSVRGQRDRGERDDRRVDRREVPKPDLARTARRNRGRATDRLDQRACGQPAGRCPIRRHPRHPDRRLRHRLRDRRRRPHQRPARGMGQDRQHRAVRRPGSGTGS